MFSSLPKTNFYSLDTFILSSADAFNLELFKIDTFILSSADAFNLEVFKILLFGKDLTYYQTTTNQTGPNWNKLQTTI